MKTLVLSPDDLQNFNKFIYDPKSAAHLAASAGAIGAAAAAAAAVQQPAGAVQLVTGGVGVAAGGMGIGVMPTAVSTATTTSAATANNNLMALHYYLKHPGAPQPQMLATTTSSSHQQQLHHHHQQQQQQLLAQSQTQLKQLQLKQPTIHQHQQHISYHHPYYQQQQQQQQQSIQLSSNSHLQKTQSQTQHQQQLQQQQQQQSHHHLPVHALNQNSNFSAASSSTGGTASSHAPTLQSNGSSVSPNIISRVTPQVAQSTNPHSTSTTSNTTNIAAAANALLRAANPATCSSSSSSSSSSSASNSSATSTSSSAGSSNASSSTNCAKKLKTEPVLSQYNQTERLNFANTYIVWSEEHWRRVIFHDERRFNLDGPDGFSYYFHDLRNYERTLSQRPRGNSVYIYLVICVGGALHLEVTSAKQRPESCIEAILRERPNIVSKLGGSTEFVLQDHNWMSHALPTAQELLNAEGLKTQKWPTVAHDLNIMENIWGWLIREVFDGGRKFSRKDDLIFRIKEAWSRLPLDLITNLYSTLPERITELYYTQGVYTNC
ncbi:uncharacterized protein Dwil_GK22900 [Drosophila willistoni]|uniref:Tc1-like transposase DDE domain-containing protein n=1 Tax=Drosophila willistoni TaxID=7260 RepID=B4NNF2_DROWI|nr:probable basic-leucine zipper transcription factor Q [Drosophila willistoni]EDW85891.2 uncharacterized protein Dwil_GK22900 [Drosophila willistoni]